MPLNNNKDLNFMFLVFTELNDHIRATDEKNIVIAGSFFALTAVVIALFLEKFGIIDIAYFIFSLFILTIGSCVFMLQLWYRRWKEHYLSVCNTIASNFNLNDKFLPFWLRKHQGKRMYSIDRFVIIITQLINIAILIYSLYLFWYLIKWTPIIKILVELLLLTIYLLSNTIMKKKFISKQDFLPA